MHRIDIGSMSMRSIIRLTYFSAFLFKGLTRSAILIKLTDDFVLNEGPRKICLKIQTKKRPSWGRARSGLYEKKGQAISGRGISRTRSGSDAVAMPSIAKLI